MTTIKRICIICNKEFLAWASEVNRGRGKTCSRLCRFQNHANLMRGHKMKPEAKKKLIKALTGRIRSKSHSENISKSLMGKHIGSKNGNWKGGKYMSQGRWYIRVNDHPFKHSNGYILFSHYVAEEKIGRYLTRKEHVHHIDFKKDNDLPENLYIFATESEHVTYHNLLRVGKVQEITESNLSNY